MLDNLNKNTGTTLEADGTLEASGNYQPLALSLKILVTLVCSVWTSFMITLPDGARTRLIIIVAPLDPISCMCARTNVEHRV